MTTPATIDDLVRFLDRLKAANIHYALSDPTTGAIMVEVAVPGERWEIEFHANGTIGVEIFMSEGGIQGSDRLDSLFERFSD